MTQHNIQKNNTQLPIFDSIKEDYVQTNIHLPDLKNKQEIQDIISDILFTIFEESPHKVNLDVRAVSNLKHILKYLDLQLNFFQFLPLFGVKTIQILINPQQIDKKTADEFTDQLHRTYNIELVIRGQINN